MTNEREHEDDPSYIAAADTVRFAQQRLVANGHDRDQVARGLVAGAVAAYMETHGDGGFSGAIGFLRWWVEQLEATQDAAVFSGAPPDGH